MSSRDRFGKTIDVYRVLGTTYTSAIRNASPVALRAFAHLIPHGGRILDVGCAGGRDAFEFTKRGFTVVGIDLVNVFLAEARRRVPRARFVNMDVRELKFSNCSFDAVWANAVLIHLPRRTVGTVLKKFHSILKIGGLLHIGVKEGRGSGYETFRKLGRAQRRFTYFSKREVERLVRGAGFSLLTSERDRDTLGRTRPRWVRVWACKRI